MANYPTSLPSSTPATHGEVVGEIVAIATELQPAWAGYTPSLTASTTNPTLGSSSVASGQYKQIGKTVLVEATIRFGTGMTAGSGTYFLSLPVTAASSWDTGGGNGRDIGIGTTTDDSTSINNLIAVRFFSATAVQLIVHGGTVVTHNAPVAWAVSDFIRISAVYEAA